MIQPIQKIDVNERVSPISLRFRRIVSPFSQLIDRHERKLTSNGLFIVDLQEKLSRFKASIDIIKNIDEELKSIAAGKPTITKITKNKSV